MNAWSTAPLEVAHARIHVDARVLKKGVLTRIPHMVPLLLVCGIMSPPCRVLFSAPLSGKDELSIT